LTFEVKSPDVHVLRVKVEIERLDGTPIHDDYLQEDNSLRQVVVRDAPGQTYAFSAAGIGAYYYDVPKGGEQTIMYCAEEECTIDYIFVVPNDVEITHFVWSDLPPVRLEIEQLAPSPTDTPTPAPTSTATPTSTPTPTLIATSTATPTIVLTPRAGTWTGRGTFFTEQGEERNLVVIFVVNEDGTQITMIATIYIQGPYIQGKEYDAFVAVTPQDIVDNSFSIGSHWQTSITGPWIDYAYEGTFISPTRLKGTLHGAMRIA
jgi:hypothetical protein